MALNSRDSVPNHKSTLIQNENNIMKNKSAVTLLQSDNDK